MSDTAPTTLLEAVIAESKSYIALLESLLPPAQHDASDSPLVDALKGWMER